jgi:hypothetical protein
MVEPCFIQKNSAPPVCGVHNVRLVEKQLPDELIASRYKGFTFLVCRMSGHVLNDETTGI